MIRHEYLSGLIVIGICVAGSLGISQAQQHDAFFPHPWAIVSLACGLSLLALAATWTSFGSQNYAVRVGATAVAQLLIAKVASYLAEGELWSWTFALGIYTWSLVVVCSAIRMARVRVVWQGHRPESQSESPLAEDLTGKYSMMQLLSFMTACSILFAFWTRPELPWKLSGQASLYFGFLAFIAMASMWSGLRAKISLNLLLVFCGVCMSVVWFRILRVDGLNHASLIALALALQISVQATAILYRCLGYGMVVSKKPSLGADSVQQNPIESTSLG